MLYLDPIIAFQCREKGTWAGGWTSYVGLKNVRGPPPMWIVKKKGCERIWSRTQLLNMLIQYWDLKRETIVINEQVLTIELEDIYFIIDLSHCFEVVNLKGGP